MGQILRGSATTTHAIHAAIQRSKAPLKEPAAQTERILVAIFISTSTRITMEDGGSRVALEDYAIVTATSECCDKVANRRA
jgi:hypothetical protein